MYCYKDDKYNTFKELTSSGGLSDPSDEDAHSPNAFTS